MATFAFGKFEVHADAYELRADGVHVKMEPKVFEVLVYLIERRERVVSKGELLDAIWPNEHTTQAVLHRCVGAARKALGDTRAKQWAIQTVHGRGYRFVAPVDAGAKAGRPAGRGAPLPTVGEGSVFVGRDAAVADLDAGVDALLAGRGSLFVLVGEAGIGKTRTAELVAGKARDRGARVTVCRCHDLEAPPPLWPWTQVLRAAGAAGLAPSPDEAELDEQQRFAFFDEVASHLRVFAEEAPQVVVLDDLHWADGDSLHLLRFVARELDTLPVLFLATARDVRRSAGHALSLLLGQVARQSRCARIDLAGLRKTETSRLIEALTDRTPDASVVDAVQHMSDGNPLFIGEMARAVVDSDATIESVALPSSLTDAVRLRVGSLSPKAGEVLRAASALGIRFELATLRSVVALEGAELLDALDEMVAERLLLEDASMVGAYAFHHSLLQRALYDSMSTGERVRLHETIVTALERAGGDDPLDALAHHALAAARAGNADRAVDYCERAAIRARRAYAYDLAAEHYARALEALELSSKSDASRRTALLVSRAGALSSGGRRDESRKTFLDAAELARANEDAEALGLAALGHRGPSGLMGMRDEAGRRLTEEALRAVGEAHPSLRARLLAALAGIPPCSDSMETRESLSQEALALARSSGDVQALREALHARDWAAVGPDRVHERLETVREMIDAATRLDEPRMELLANRAAIRANQITGNAAETDRAVERYTEVAERLRQPWYLFLSSYFRSARAVAKGDFARADALAQDGLARGPGVPPFARGAVAALLYWSSTMRGAELPLDAVGPRTETVIEGSWAPLATTFRIRAAVAHGKLDEARALVDSLGEGNLASLPRNEHWLFTMECLVAVATSLDDHGLAARLVSLLEPYADLIVTDDVLSYTSVPVSTLLGRAARALGELDDAAGHYSRALETATRFGALPALLATKAGCSLVLRDRGDAAHDTLRKDVEAGCRQLGIRPGAPSIWGESADA